MKSSVSPENEQSENSKVKEDNASAHVATTPVAKKDPKTEAPTEGSDFLENAIDECLAQRKAKAELRKSETAAKAILQKAKVTHNEVFQRAHGGLRMKGHWKEFLEIIAGGRTCQCSAYEQIIVNYHVPIVPSVLEEEELPQAEMELVDAESALAVVAGAGAGENKRTRRGRPRKGEERSFDSEIEERMPLEHR